ncbi:MAG: hypothetical protein FJ088_15570, partial [Deltaproteobacteria bacterium]|nr:hypothetical protein [Deltaproteobacteria bacterium]
MEDSGEEDFDDSLSADNPDGDEKEGDEAVEDDYTDDSNDNGGELQSDVNGDQSNPDVFADIMDEIFDVAEGDAAHEDIQIQPEEDAMFDEDAGKEIMVPDLCAGAAEDFALLSLGLASAEVSLGSATYVEGNVGAKFWVAVGAAAVVTGDVVLPVSDGVLSDALSLADAASSLAADVEADKIEGGEIDCGAGFRVYKVKDMIVPAGEELVIDCEAGAAVVFNVSEHFNFGAGSKLSLKGGIQPE